MLIPLPRSEREDVVQPYEEGFCCFVPVSRLESISKDMSLPAATRAAAATTVEHSRAVRKKRTERGIENRQKRRPGGGERRQGQGQGQGQGQDQGQGGHRQGPHGNDHGAAPPRGGAGFVPLSRLDQIANDPRESAETRDAAARSRDLGSSLLSGRQGQGQHHQGGQPAGQPAPQQSSQAEASTSQPQSQSLPPPTDTGTALVDPAREQQPLTPGQVEVQAIDASSPTPAPAGIESPAISSEAAGAVDIEISGGQAALWPVTSDAVDIQFLLEASQKTINPDTLSKTPATVVADPPTSGFPLASPSTTKIFVYNADSKPVVTGPPARNDVAAPSTNSVVNRCFNTSLLLYQFFETAFGRKSVRGGGEALHSTVFFGDKYMNAHFMNGQMIYGAGDGVKFGNFANSLDVSGHELTHGIVEFTCGLLYRFQSGALNEHLADVFGALFDQYIRNHKVSQADWVAGKDVELNAPFYSRSFIQPGQGSPAQPWTMLNYQNYLVSSDSGGVHINSGILNYAFYSAAWYHGGDTYAWKHVGKVWYEAMTAKRLATDTKTILESDATFLQFANLVLELAPRFAPDVKVEHILKAFRDVSVFSNTPPPPSATEPGHLSMIYNPTNGKIGIFASSSDQSIMFKLFTPQTALEVGAINWEYLGPEEVNVNEPINPTDKTQVTNKLVQGTIAAGYADSNTFVFWVNSNSKIRFATHWSGVWYSSYALPDSTSVFQQVAPRVLSTGSTMYVFALTTTGDILYTYGTFGNYSAWAKAASGCTADFTITLRNGFIDLYVVLATGKMAVTTWFSTGWTALTDLGGSFLLLPPVVAQYNATTTFILGVDSSSKTIRTKLYDGTTLTPSGTSWILGPVVDGTRTPTVSGLGASRVSIYTRNGVNIASLLKTDYENGEWKPSTAIGIPNAAAIVATEVPNIGSYLFTLGNDYKIYRGRGTAANPDQTNPVSGYLG